MHQTYKPWGTHRYLFFYLLIHALQCWVETWSLSAQNYSHLASVHLPTAATAERHNPEQGTRGYWMKPSQSEILRCSFPDSIRVAESSTSFWLLICAERLFCPDHLFMCNAGFELLPICFQAFLCWMLLLLLHCLHSSPTSLHTYAHNCTTTVDRSYFVLFINTTSL